MDVKSRVVGPPLILAAALLSSCGSGDDPPPICETVGCEGLGFECGVHEECGRTIDCGTCPGDSRCVEGLCEACLPDTCPTLGVECGTAPDGCGGLLDCGSCEHGLECDGGVCVPREVEESFCEPLAIPDSGVTIIETSDDLAAAMRDAPAGQTLLLEDGTYSVPAAGLWFGADGVTLRGRSGDREGVILDGNYQQSSGGIVNVYGRRDITIAHLTITRPRHHAVHATGGPDGPSDGLLLYDLLVRDPGEQAIKLNANHDNEVDDGELACSLIELTDTGREQVMSYAPGGHRCYTGGIDAHRSRGWVVRDNLIRGFWCSNQYLSQHGVHFWRGARDTLVERNFLVDNARGIGFGLGNPGSGRTYDEPCSSGSEAEHYGGIIRNNIIVGLRPELFASHYGMDLGIGLESACDAVVAHNTVASTEAPFVSIEWRFTSTSGLIINNAASHAIRPRNEAVAETSANVASADPALFEDLAALDLTPAATAADLLGQGDPRGTTIAPTDHRGARRAEPPDIGALERPEGD